MSFFMLLVLFITSVYGLSVAYDLYVYSKSFSISENNLYIGLHIHLIGLVICAYLFNYEIEQTLQSYLSIDFPIITLLKVVSAFLLVIILYNWLINHYTVLNTVSWIIPFNAIVLTLLIMFTLWAYTRIPFYTLQLTTMNVISISSSITGLAMYPVIDTTFKQENDQVRLIKFRWFNAFQSVLFFAMVLYVIDSSWKLFSGTSVIYNPVYGLAEIMRMTTLTSIFLMNHGFYLTWFSYPSKLRQYQHIKNLNQYIQTQADVQDVIFDVRLPRPTPRKIDMLLFRQYVTVLDTYQFLPLDSSLRKSIHATNNPDVQYDDSLTILSKLGEDYE